MIDLKNNKRKRELGVIAIALIVFLGLALCMLATVFYLSTKTVQSNATLEEGYTTALSLAEAGAERAIWRLSQDPDYRAGYGDPQGDGVPFYYPNSTQELGRYWVEMSTVQTGPGYAIVRITASARVKEPRIFGLVVSQGVTKKIEELVRVNLKTLPVGPRQAITSGGQISLQASSNIYGSIRSNGSITFNANTDIYPDPFYHEGRVLTFKNINVSAQLKLHDSSSDLQDVRAREAIIGQSKIKGTNDGIFPYDTTVDTDMMITDGSIEPGESGIYIPNPAMTEILSAVTQTHTDETVINSNFYLNGGVHLFPKGVEFRKKVYGPGTIVVTNGYNATFSNPVGNEQNPEELNMIVISGTDGVIGQGKVYLQESYIKGLIYCHNNIAAQAKWAVIGAVICYKGQVVVSQANSTFSLTPTFPVNPPGFSKWWQPAGGVQGQAGAVTKISWREVF